MISNKDIVKEFTPQDTKDIQIKSVCAFMKEFNYLLHVDGKFYSNTFWDWDKCNREDPYFQGCEVIRMNTAVTLHNRNWRIREIIGVDEGVFKIDPYTLNKAQAAKIVKQVFLHGTKYGGVKCHKHWVRFVDQSYQYMFLECSPEVHA